ncbi:unnamed protein product [Gulo gulo]|uniref:Uncharacterized protein n=1 Tax=Gulo gulo TaxID=48420 RepID=A0A9X9LXL6_GULGU|nr:unnamed protein product [Gulo gulo]
MAKSPQRSLLGYLLYANMETVLPMLSFLCYSNPWWGMGFKVILQGCACHRQPGPHALEGGFVPAPALTQARLLFLAQLQPPLAAP